MPELRIGRIQVIVTADLVDEERKIDEVMVGLTDENGTRPYVFYDLEALTEWAGKFPADLEKLNTQESEK